MPALDAGFFGSWKQKALSLITFHHTLTFHRPGALTLKYLNAIGLLWIFSPQLCLLKNTRAFVSSEKKIKRAKFTKSNKKMLYIVFSYGRTEPLDLCREIHIVGVEAVLLPPAFPLGFCQEGIASYGCRSHTLLRIFIPDRAALSVAVLAPIL